MTPLPPPLGPGGLVGWRLDRLTHAPTWDSGEGAFQVPGRWHHKGFRMVYAALDPATAILEVAVHKGFDTLDRVAHVQTGFRWTGPEPRVFQPDEVPNPRWLTGHLASRGQRDWGQEQLVRYPAILLPSAVSPLSWNLLFRVPQTDTHEVFAQTRLSTDTRLAPDPPG